MARAKIHKTRALVSCLICIAEILIAGIAAFAGVLSASALSAYAAESYPYDGTAIGEDLEGLGAEIPDISVPGEDVQLLALAEFAFAEDSADCENYALYLYVYDPAGHSYSTVTDENAVNMAVSYDGNGEADGYADLPLVYCSNTEDKTVWKYRVVDEDGQVLGNALLQDAADGKRRYDVVGVQLREVGEAMAEDHKVGRTFYYEGYAEGMSGESALASTLTVNNEKVVSLDVHQTFYRPEGINKENENRQDTLASVFFNIPNEYIEEYGELYAVHAEFLKALLSPMIVTNNQAFIDKMSGLQFQDQSGMEYACIGNGRGYYNVEGIFGGVEFYSDVIFDPGGNVDATLNGNSGLGRIDQVNMVFEPEEEDKDKSIFDCVITSERLQSYLEENAENKDVLGRYDSRYFSSIDEEKTDVRLTTEDEFSLTSITFNQFWLFIWGTETEYTMPAIQRIEKVESAEQVERDYYIDEGDYEELKAVYDKPNSTTYVFHFYQSSDFVETGMLLRRGVNYPANLGDMYFAQQNIYLDFDVIDVSMNDGEKITVLGVVSDPIDVIPDLPTPPDVTPVWWIVAVIIAAVLIIILIIVQIVRNQSGGKAK